MADTVEKVREPAVNGLFCPDLASLRRTKRLIWLGQVFASSTQFAPFQPAPDFFNSIGGWPTCPPGSKADPANALPTAEIATAPAI